MPRPLPLLACLFACLGPAVAADGLQVSPKEVILDGPESTHQLLAAVGPTDVSHRAKYDVADGVVAGVTARGLLEPRGEGSTDVRVQYNGQAATVKVTVRGVRQPAAVSFEQEVMPILTKAGCNSGGCHGKAEGQNGFKLSVFGFDPEADHKAIVTAESPRAAGDAGFSPVNSLLVTEGDRPQAAARRRGGRLLEGTLAHKRLVRWVAEGMRYRTPEAPPVVSLELDPPERVLALGGSQQIRVTAIDARGAGGGA